MDGFEGPRGGPCCWSLPLHRLADPRFLKPWTSLLLPAACLKAPQLYAVRIGDGIASWDRVLLEVGLVGRALAVPGVAGQVVDTAIKDGTGAADIDGGTVRHKVRGIVVRVRCRAGAGAATGSCNALGGYARAAGDGLGGGGNAISGLGGGHGPDRHLGWLALWDPPGKDKGDKDPQGLFFVGGNDADVLLAEVWAECNSLLSRRWLSAPPCAALYLRSQHGERDQQQQHCSSGGAGHCEVPDLEHLWIVRCVNEVSASQAHVKRCKEG